MLKEHCYECGEELQENDPMYQVEGGEYICESCRDDYYVSCDDCGCLVYYADAQMVYGWDSEQLVCQECLNERYVYCDHCEEYVNEAEIWTSSSRLTICEQCYVDHYFTCASCGLVYHVNESDDTGYYCSDCASEQEDCIWSYSHKPIPVFYGGAAGYGLELEIDDGDSKQDAAYDISEAGGDHIYLKEDGSLSHRGMEIVTHPATLDYHINEFPWNEICDVASSYGYRSHDTDTCGLHIHASRSLFGKTETEQDLTIAKIMLLIDRWYNTKIVKFARRDIEKMRRWADKPNAAIRRDDDEYSAIQKSKDSSRGNRYKAVNLCNSNTVEFRFFKGTLKRDTIIASIQWVDTIIKYCRSTPLKDLWSSRWDEIFCNTEYEELTAYLKQRGLYE